MNCEKKNVIALGFFDGVHLGHQALLRCAVLRAAQRSMCSAVFTFDRSPREFVSGIPVPLITAPERREEALRQHFPIEKIFTVPFDREMMTMEWSDFVTMLVQQYHAGHLVAGHSFRFGHNNTGTPALLQEKAAELGIGCDIIPPVMVEGRVVSSTEIRTLLCAGEMETAARLLGTPYVMGGRVHHGKGLGRTIGAPTLNLIPNAHQLIPAYGVYATRVRVNGEEYAAVTNVGVRPTVEDDGAVTVESHLIDVTVPCYGSECRVTFWKRLRGEQRFSDLSALRAQIAEDIANTREYFD